MRDGLPGLSLQSDIIIICLAGLQFEKKKKKGAHKIGAQQNNTDTNIFMVNRISSC